MENLVDYLKSQIYLEADDEDFDHRRVIRKLKGKVLKVHDLRKCEFCMLLQKFGLMRPQLTYNEQEKIKRQK